MSPKTPSLRGAGPASYAQLRDKVRSTLLEGQQKVEQQKVLTYWQTGKHLQAFLLGQEDRAEYGKQVIEKLAEDLSLESRILWRCLQFLRCFPILSARTELTWAHYRVLITVPDEKKRDQLCQKAVRNEWTSRELEIEARNYRWAERVAEAEETKAAKLPPVKLGGFHTYQIVRPVSAHDEKRRLLLDCGFSFKKELDQFDGNFREGMIAASVKSGRGYALKPIKEIPKNPNDLLFTYKAYVVEVIDADTLKVDFRLGFGDRKGETIRLNSIDCPEMTTAEGKAAKRFVESLLSGVEFVIIKSIKTRKEKWGRYLGDVFIPKKGSSEPIYLNQMLLDKGHAVKVRS